MGFVVLVIACIGLLAAPQGVAAEVKSHPAVTPYEGSVATRRDDDGFRSYSLVTGVDAKGKTDEEALQTLKVEGNVIRFSYENPKGRSAHEIYANYREGLEKGGFQILFSCAEAECGPGFATSRWGRVTGLRYFSPQMRYVAAKGSKGGQTIYVAVLVAPVRHQLEIVEVAEMEKGLVTAEAIAEGLMRDGRVVLDGILFDTDKTTIKAESKVALAAIAKFLADNPAVKVYIVGHTDGTGELAYNLQLSRGRAAAVVAALVEGYGIAAGRLAAHGVGPLVPMRTNKSEAGRVENRRVEMVEM